MENGGLIKINNNNNNNNNNNKFMNKNIDLTKILKNCPIGTEFYHLLYNKVYFVRIEEDDDYPIYFSSYPNALANITVTKNGKHFKDFDGDCIIFPSKEQRDWSKFTAPWYKKDKFDPKTLKPFDKVLVRDKGFIRWRCTFYSHLIEDNDYKYVTAYNVYKYCIPYNDDTKHLVGTAEEAPKYYRYWEN